MQDIHELIQVLEHHRIHFPRPTLSGGNDEAMLFRLFDGVRTGQFATDAAAASDIFPGASADHSGYFETRSMLRDRLSRAIEQFVSEMEQLPDVKQAHLECQRLWLNVRTLSGQNAARVALYLATQILRIAEKFDFTLLAMDVAMYLRLQHCMRGHESDLCADADARYQYYHQVLDAEFRAEKMYTDLTALCVAGQTPEDEVLRLATLHSEALVQLMAKFPSAKVILYGNMVEWQRHLAAHDYAAAMHQCEKAIRFFLDKPYCARDPLQVFYYQSLLCSIHLRDVETGELAARTCLDFAQENVINRFKIKELLLLLYLHTKCYDKAFELYDEVATDPQFAFLPKTLRSNWVVCKPYLAFVVASGVATLPPKNLASLGLSVADAQTQKGAWLVVDFAVLLQEKRFAEVRTRMPALQRLAYPDSNGAATSRTAIFAQMLLLLPATDFRRSKTVHLAGPYLSKLHSTPLVMAYQTQELEVMPFEDMWELVLQSLEE